MRCIGKGAESAVMFCGIMNLPPPPTKFTKFNNILLQAARETCEESMAEAVHDAVEENEGGRDIAVAVDGSWQKRGFSSKNGVVTVTSVDTVVCEAVSIPDVFAVIQAINTTHQCLKADARLAEYIAAIPLINFERTEDQINYEMDLLSIQEEARLKFCTIKQEEFRLENERYKELLNSWGLPDNNYQTQSKKIQQNHPLQKKQKTTSQDPTECNNRFNNLTVEEPPEKIEIDQSEDEDVTPPVRKKYMLLPLQ
ncbi:uncharacterized protein NPIL_99571 [Nephila pilipes]|uniref:Mutator-like transposase domain-containing protein n=1 Tax=Nephila pilipes TaxID=299642 RepID=A0A8X6PKA1_NEPPI|nr:uncharacterized protein NPIL_99571 [Nephila pilipes]